MLLLGPVYLEERRPLTETKTVHLQQWEVCGRFDKDEGRGLRSSPRVLSGAPRWCSRIPGGDSGPGYLSPPPHLGGAA